VVLEKKSFFESLKTEREGRNGKVGIGCRRKWGDLFQKGGQKIPVGKRK